MPDSGGVYSRVYDWTDDRDAAVPITASRMDSEFDSITNALNNRIFKDGTGTITANIPWSGFRITGLGAATARTDAARAAEIQDGAIWYGAVAGTDTYTITLSPAPTALVNGQIVIGKFTNGNTGASTLNVNSIGAIAIRKKHDQALVSGDIEANSIVFMVYNSTIPCLEIIGPDPVTYQPLDADLTTIAALTVARGSIIYGNSSPAWAALALGAAGTGLFSDGTDLAYSKVKALHLAAEAIAGTPLINGKLVASAASNILTIAIKTLAGNDPSASDPVWIRLPDETVATGAPDVVAITSAQSVAIPNTATMGTSNSVAFRLWIVGFNSSAAFAELGVVNCLSGTDVLPLEEGALYSSTAIGTGSDNAQVIYSTAGQTNKPFRILGYVEYTSGLATAGTWSAAPDIVRQMSPGVKRPGDRVRRAEGAYTTYASGATAMPADDTIPQSGEGDQTVTAAITPRSAANILVVRAIGQVIQLGSNRPCFFALFRDSVADAKRAIIAGVTAQNFPLTAALDFSELAGSTSTTTFKLRVGTASGTNYFNGDSSARQLGGVAAHMMSIEEIMA